MCKPLTVLRSENKFNIFASVTSLWIVENPVARRLVQTNVDVRSMGLTPFQP